MRLTLRTLLAYLDDTLEPAQAKLIGEKVAESDIAPDLIERIKKVTRRRGLNAPLATGDGEDDTTDPNAVAEYLDNTLSSEQLGEVEQAALASDAYLAEVSACHQILTLVLGEPARVPPTARERMYRLVSGKESIPYRKSAPALNVPGLVDPTQPAEENTDADEALLLGMTGNQLFVPIASAAVILTLLVAVIWMAIPTPKPEPTQGYLMLSSNMRPEPEPKPKQIDQPKKDQVVKADKPKAKVEDPKVKVEPDPKKEAVAKGPELLPEPRVVPGRPLIGKGNKPDPERRAFARLESKDAILLQRRRDADEWERAVPLKDLFTIDSLMSLPGMRNEVKLETGVRLLLWGTMPEYHLINELDILESRVTLYVPPIGIDADFTLESGRVFITRPATKGQPFEPAKVRVRFKDELWEITLLDADTEVCVDLLGYYSEGVPFSKEPGGPAPTTEVTFALLKGRAGLKLKFKEYPMLEAPTRIGWDSSAQDKTEPAKVPVELLEYWSKTIKENEGSKQLQLAVNHYIGRFSKPDEARIDVVFFSAMQDMMEQPSRRLLAVRSLQALDAFEYLVEGMADDAYPMRTTAIRCVQHWTGLAGDRDLMLYKALLKKAYTEPQAQVVLQLLHPFDRDEYAKFEIVSALFDAMKNEKVLIRELAYKHLAYCDQTGSKEVGFFDANAPARVRDPILQKWKASWKLRFVDMKK